MTTKAQATNGTPPAAKPNPKLTPTQVEVQEEEQQFGQLNPTQIQQLADTPDCFPLGFGSDIAPGGQ